MGIRLERFGLDSSSPGTFYHDELKNRELPDSHPIKAITGLEETLQELRENIEESSTQLGIIQVADTKSVDLNFDLLSKTLTGEVILSPDANNAIIEKNNGLYVQAQAKLQAANSDTVSHSIVNDVLTSKVRIATTTNNELEVLDDGLYVPRIYDSDTIINSTTLNENDQIDLREVYDYGIRFSLPVESEINNLTNDIHRYPSIESSWVWDETNKSFRQPINQTGSFNGFISDKIIPSDYKATIRLVSTDNDDDCNGVVLGYKKIDGVHHMLTAYVYPAQGNIMIGYNIGLPGKVFLYNKNIGTERWDRIDCYKVKINKIGANISVTFYHVAKNLTETIAATFNINLLQWSYIKHFINDFSFGFCNESQAESYYQILEFDYTSEAKSLEVKIDPAVDNIIEVTKDGLYIPRSVIALKTGNTNTITHTVKDNMLTSDVKMSTALDNRLKVTKDGLYVPDFTVPLSEEKDNMIVAKPDGIYVPTHKDSQTIVQGLTEEVSLDVVFNGIMNGTSNTTLITPSTYRINGANPFLYPEYSFATDDIDGTMETVTSSLTFGAKYELTFDIVLTTSGNFNINLLKTEYYVVCLSLTQNSNGTSRLFIQKIIDGKLVSTYILQSHEYYYSHDRLFRVTVKRDNGHFFITADITYECDITGYDFVLDKGTGVGPMEFLGHHDFHIGLVRLVDPTLMAYDNKMHVKVSAQTGNQLQIVDDGLCVPAPPEEIIYTQEDLQAAADEILGG